MWHVTQPGLAYEHTGHSGLKCPSGVSIFFLQLKLSAPCFSCFFFLFSNVKYSSATEHLCAYHWPLQGTLNRQKEQECFITHWQGEFLKVYYHHPFFCCRQKKKAHASLRNAIKEKKRNLKSWSSVAVVFLSSVNRNKKSGCTFWRERSFAGTLKS